MLQAEARVSTKVVAMDMPMAVSSLFDTPMNGHRPRNCTSTKLLTRIALITTNCAVLGVALLNINKDHNFLQSLFYGFGAAVGFSLVLVLFAAMRERLAVADVPTPFKGAAIGMITAGLMSLAFMGFAGLV